MAASFGTTAASSNLHIHLKRLALDDAEHERGKRLSPALASRAIALNDGMSWYSIAAAERVGQELLDHDRHELIRVAAQPVRSATGPSIFVLSNTSPDASTGAPSSTVRQLAMPSKFSSANPIGSIKR